MQEVNIEKTDFTLWEIEFEFTNSYDREKFTFEQARKDFFEKVGVDALEDEDDKLFSEIVLSTEIIYYSCDSGHGSNIINDCLNALKKDSPGFNEMDYEYRWNKLDYNDYLDEQYISWALDISSYGQIEYKDGILSGDCLLLVWDDCNCDQCENEL